MTSSVNRPNVPLDSDFILLIYYTTAIHEKQSKFQDAIM